MTLSQLIERVESQPETIQKVVFKPKSQGIEATLIGGDTVRVNYASPDSQFQFQNLLERQGVAFDSSGTGGSSWGFLVYLLPFVLFIGLWLFLMRSMQGGGGKLMSFGKSRAKRVSPDSPR